MIKHMHKALFGAILLFAGCSLPWLTSRPGRTTSSSAAGEKRIETTPAQNDSVKFTFLDTLNRGAEIGLAESNLSPSSGGQTFTESDIESPAQRSASPGASATASSSSRFRIQVMASSQIENIREKKKELEVKTRLPVFISFESPFYKLLAGDFADRSEADAALPAFKKLGYPDAWIVRTKAIITQ